jgi:hypothetical protein
MEALRVCSSLDKDSRCKSFRLVPALADFALSHLSKVFLQGEKHVAKAWALKPASQKDGGGDLATSPAHRYLPPWHAGAIC